MRLEFQPGRYLGHITGWGINKAQTGTPQIVVKFRVVGQLGADNAVTTIANPKERTVFRAITEKTIDFVVEDLQWLGYHAETFDAMTLPTDHPDAPDWLDKEIEVVCQHDSYNGTPKERWNFGRGGGSFEIKPAESSEIRKLNALYKKNLKPLSEGPKPDRRTPTPAPAVSEPNTEEIPF